MTTAQFSETTSTPIASREDIYNAAMEHLRTSCKLLVWALPDEAVEHTAQRLVEMFQFYTAREAEQP